MPANAGIQKPGKILDSGMRRNDDNIGHWSISWLWDRP